MAERLNEKAGSGETVQANDPGNDDAQQNGARCEHADKTPTAEVDEGTTQETTQGTTTSATGADEGKFPKPAVIALLAAGLCTVVFAMAVDNTILATAIPRIADDFRSLDDVGWYRSAYLVASTALQPSLGKVYTILNVKWTYLAGLVVFEVGSVVCALAPSSGALIAGRTVAGVGGAALYSGAVNILALAAPLRMRPLLFSLLTGMFAIASLVGPPLGGVFADSPALTWRWCFWINLPLGAFAFAVILGVFRVPSARKLEGSDPESKRLRQGTTESGGPSGTVGSPPLPPPPPAPSLLQKAARFDPLGTLLLVPAVVCLLLALQWGGTKYAWGDARVWGCLLAFGLLTIALVSSQLWGGDNATLPPRVMRQRTVIAGALQMACSAAAMFAQNFFLPFYFQVVLGTTATGSGVLILPYVVTMAVIGIFAGAGMSQVSSYKPFGWVGTAIFVIGSGLLYTLKVDSPTASYIGFQVIIGVGTGIAWQVPFVAVQRASAKGKAIKASDGPIANALMAFFNSLGASLGISIAQNVFASSLQNRLAAVPGITAAQIATIMNAGTGVGLRDPNVLPSEMLLPVLTQYNSAIRSTFIVATVFSGLGFLASLLYD
ncbi:MFS transporter [Colletotrichum higginsianum IMI 349063]|uniref:MFS transporter n=1 Tax=Colletotrichum higginsianum (strain IMI 349063) TaxID=759273 RepID=A0A1B7Y3V4_COLHI|nr:MFS transporter [Colletotrichum higginsianum IMI 349063]OBR06691.1 MFS transporter [Colletotrichum higginsianum IMI 349063]